MHIIHISEFYPPNIRGGGEISSSIIHNEMSSEHRVTILTSKVGMPPTSENLKVHPILWPFFPLLDRQSGIVKYIFGSLIIFPILNAIIVYKFLLKSSVDLIEIETNTPLWFPTFLLCSLLNKATVVSIRDSNLICVNGSTIGSCQNENLADHNCLFELFKSTNQWSKAVELFRPIFAVLKFVIFFLYRSPFIAAINFKRNAIVATPSNYLAKQLLRLGLQREKIIHIANPLSIVSKTKAKNMRLKQFIFAGRLEREKGIYDAIEAFYQFSLSNKLYQFLIYGDGTETDNVKKYIRKLNCKILMKGRSDQQSILTQCSKSAAIIAPSRWPEPFGRFYLDSITSQTPLITTKSGELKSLVCHLKNGILVDTGSTSQLCEAMQLIATKPYVSTEIRMNLMNDARKYQPSNLTKQRVAMYKKIISINEN